MRVLVRRRSHISKLLAIALGVILGAHAAQASVASQTDPFRVGYSLSGAYQERGGSSETAGTVQLQLTRGWKSGVALGLGIPLVLAGSTALSPGSRAPRIGGGPLGRISLEGTARVWGDSEDYLGVGFGIAFPFQTDPSLRDGLHDTWAFPLSLFGRLHWGPLSWKLLVTNVSTFPTTTQRGALPLYFDQSNSVAAITSISCFPASRVSPFVGYVEAFPRRLEVGLALADSAFAATTIQISRARQLLFGVEIVPLAVGLVAALEGSYTLTELPAGVSSAQLGLRIRWNP